MELQIKPPKELSFVGNVSENWKAWKQLFKIFMRASGKEQDEDEQIKVAYFMNLIGEEGIKVFNSLKLDEDTNSLADILGSFETYCSPRKNLVYDRFTFLNVRQKTGQTFDSYLTELRTAAAKCEYGDQEESIIRDQIIFGVADPSTKEHLLRDPNMTLVKTIDYCRATETSRIQVKELLGEAKKIEAVKTTSGEEQKYLQKRTESRVGYNKHKNSDRKTCSSCGYNHAPNKCPAQNKTCLYCQGRNHFAKVCKKKIGRPRQMYECKKDTVGPSDNSDDSGSDSDGNGQWPRSLYVHSVEGYQPGTAKEAWYEKIKVGGKDITFKLDSGAEISVITYSIFKQMFRKEKLKPTNSKLVSWGNNGFKTKTEGVMNMMCETRKHKKAMIEFVVADVTSVPILGLRACVALKLIKRIDSVMQAIGDENKTKLMKLYKDVFTGIGKVPGKHHIVVDPRVAPVVRPPRRIPLTLHERLRVTLNQLEQDKVIRKVSYPTRWVSNIVITEKKDGQLRICMDPKDLNEAIQREHYMLPTPEDILSRLGDKTIFSVVDMKNGFWHIQLDQDSADLCTFATPFGRYQFLCLPFGVSSAPEVFQKKNIELLGDLPGVEIYFDDIIVGGKTEEEHDTNLLGLLARAKKYNIKFNAIKFQHRTPEVTYIGQVISKRGVKMDHKHLQAIRDMDSPKNKEELGKFLGMIKYLAKFIPSVSQITAPLRELTKDHIKFCWEDVHEEAIKQLKKIITSDPVLAHFDGGQPITIQTDASKDGLGSCLLQGSRPIAFASRSLTECEKRYAQIEKEMLAIVYACEKFHYYIYADQSQ